jgi:hypothetical protein
MSTITPTAEAGLKPDPFGSAGTPVTTPPSEFDDVTKNLEPRVWTVQGTLLRAKRLPSGQTMDEELEFSREYLQEPLSYNGIVQFVGLLSRKLEEIMSGPTGLSLGNIIELVGLMQPQEGEDVNDPEDQRNMLMRMLGQGNVSGVDTFVKGFLKLVGYVPDILDEAQCIWLRVPFRDRMFVREIWAMAPGKGGLNRQEGSEMFNVFISQNYEELEGFLVEEARKMWTNIQRERKRIHPGA